MNNPAGYPSVSGLPYAGQDLRMHHIGFVVRDISNEIEDFAASLGAGWEGRVYQDPLQLAKVAFLHMPCSTDAQIELIEPAGENSPVFQFLQKGGGLHHICYETSDLNRQLEVMRAKGAIVVRRPRPAVAFNNRAIAWVVTKQRLLVELLQQELEPA